MRQTLEFFARASTLTAQVKRMDTHGNVFSVKTEMHPAAAEQLAIEMENRGHKQTYWVENDIATTDKNPFEQPPHFK